MEDVVGLEARSEDPIGVRVLGVIGGLEVVFVGLRVLARPAVLRFSRLLDRVIVDLLSDVDETGFVAGVFPVVPARDILFGVPPIAGVLFSSPDPAIDFVFSSTELIEARDLCNELGVVPVVPVAGLRAVELIVGRVGGLLRLLPIVVRGAVLEPVLVAEDGVEVTGRFDVVRGLLGGTPFLDLGELIAGAAGWCTVSSIGSVSTAGASSIVAMIALFSGLSNCPCLGFIYPVLKLEDVR